MTEASTTGRSTRGEWIPTGIALVVAIVAAWMFVPRPAPPTASFLEPTVVVGSLDQPATMGAVVDGPVRVKVSDPEWSGSTLVVLVQVANTTSQPQQVKAADFQATNPITGAAYPAVAGAPLTEPLSTRTLAPGEIAHGQIGFTAPNAGGDAIIVDRGSSPARAWELLGL